MDFMVTLFDDVYATSCHTREVTVDELAELIDKTKAPKKDLLPLLKLAKFRNVRSAQNSLRHDANVTAITGVELDYDGEQMPFAEAASRLNAAGLAFILYTTGRHTPAAPRWRGLLPCSKELPPTERTRLVNRTNACWVGF